MTSEIMLENKVNWFYEKARIGLVSLAVLGATVIPSGCHLRTSPPPKEVEQDAEGNAIYGLRSRRWINRFDIPLERAIEIGNIKDEEGKPKFNLLEVCALGIREIDVDYIEDMVSIENEEGEQVFDTYTLLLYNRVRGTKEYAETLAKKGLSDDQIFKFRHLGLLADEVGKFNDTDKPNAIVIYPTSDYNGAFDTLPAVFVYSDVKKEYDPYVAVAKTEQDVYDALEKIPDAKLLLLNGHGSFCQLRLGYTPHKKGEKESEKNFIDLGDFELAEHFKKLPEDAVIALYSCATAEGGKDKNNLANRVITWADGRTVYAAKKSFSPAEALVRVGPPFRMRILKDVFDTSKMFTDVTYTNSEESIRQQFDAIISK